MTHLYTKACCLASDISSSIFSLSAAGAGGGGGDGGSGGGGAFGGGNRLLGIGEVLYPPGCCPTGFGGSLFRGGKGRPDPDGTGGSTAGGACFGEGALPNGGREFGEVEEGGRGGGSFSSLLLFLSQGGVGALLLPPPPLLLPPGLGGRNGFPPSGEVPRLPSIEEEGDIDLSLPAEPSSNFFFRSPRDSFLWNRLPDIGLVSGSTILGGPRVLLCFGLLMLCCGLGLSLCAESGPGLFSNCFIKFEIFAFFGAGGGFGLLPLLPGPLFSCRMDGLESGTGGVGGECSTFTPVGPLLTFEPGEPN